MSRDIGSTNLTEIGNAHVDVILLVKFQFDAAIYVHSGVGTISFGGNDYLGVGHLGQVEGIDESEKLAPKSVRFALSGVVADTVAEAFNAGNYGDNITTYVGYLGTDGALVADPWTLDGGKFEYAEVEIGEEDNRVIVVMRNALSRIEEKSGRRFSDEDQQSEYPGDTGLSRSHGISQQKLSWGGQTVRGGGVGGGGSGGAGSKDD